MATLYTPVPDYTGPGPAGVHFVDGRAETDDPAVIAYALRHGYEVEDAPDDAAATEAPADPKKPTKPTPTAKGA
ncbi:hypothetical protein ACIBKZ_09760 [Streptomyces sp. NPDC050421]|uniref:hypothetical protein n=1 Tax=Streptomyces sp. NPDC050421 TaxID=3365613 RepID=UPI00379A3451